MSLHDASFKANDGTRLRCDPGEARTEFVERATGLRLRVTVGGARTWSVAYWAAAARTARRLRLGDAEKMPLSQARKLARRALAAVDAGDDPYVERLAERQKEREARRQQAEERRQKAEKTRREAEERKRRTVTVEKLCREYVEFRKTTPAGRLGRVARPNTLVNWDSMLRLHVMPRLGAIPAEGLTPADVTEALTDAVKRAGPSMGPHVRDFLSAVWSWAKRRAHSRGWSLPADNPVTLAEDVGATAGERERVLSVREVWHFWRAAGNEGPEGEALRLSLLTATRVNEAARLPWSEVDLETKTWRLPENRNKSAVVRMIPLSDQAVALLRRMEGLSEEFVFGGHAVRVSEAVARIRHAMNGEHWEARDLRRTAATLCARLGADPFTVALALGHAHPDPRMPAVTKTYLRHDYQERVREVLGKLGEWIESTVSAETEPGEVIDFEASRRG